MQCQDVISLVERQFVRGATVDELRVVWRTCGLYLAKACWPISSKDDFWPSTPAARDLIRRHLPLRDLCGNSPTGTTGRQLNINTNYIEQACFTTGHNPAGSNGKTGEQAQTV